MSDDPPTNGGSEGSGSAADPFIRVQFEARRVAPLGGTALLHLTARAEFDAPDAEILFSLPPGVVPTVAGVRAPGSLTGEELNAGPPAIALGEWQICPLSGNTNPGTVVRQRVSFAKHVPQSFELEVRLLSPGEKLVSGDARVFRDTGGLQGAGKSLYLDVFPDRTDIRLTRTPPPYPLDHIPAIQITPPPSPSPRPSPTSSPIPTAVASPGPGASPTPKPTTTPAPSPRPSVSPISPPTPKPSQG